MKLAYLAIAAIAIAAPWSAAQQVYKTTDEHGNTVFTDVPPTEDAEKVDIQAPNIADSVEVRPPEPEAAPEPPLPEEAPPGDLGVVHTGNDDLREELAEERRKQELRERVGDSELTPDPPPTAQPMPSPARPVPRPAGSR